MKPLTVISRLGEFQGYGTRDLTDLYIDIVVEGNGPAYRLIDLEEYADAVSQGLINVKDMSKHLSQVQRFLENYLHRGKVFPPKQIEALHNMNINQEGF